VLNALHMKTLTEFTAMSLKQASKLKADLTQQGKTPEELPAALGEALKIEGDKLTFLLNALETVGTKVTDLKRVLVFSVAEGEKAPLGTLMKGEEGKTNGYIVEYYPSLDRKADTRVQQDPRDDGRKQKSRGKGKGRPDRNPRAPRTGQPAVRPSAPAEGFGQIIRAAGAEAVQDGNSQGHGHRRPPRAPRPPRDMEPPKKLEPLSPGAPGRIVIAPRATPLPPTAETSAAPTTVETPAETKAE
jgi:hypothetical protein